MQYGRVCTAPRSTYCRTPACTGPYCCLCCLYCAVLRCTALYRTRPHCTALHCAHYTSLTALATLATLTTLRYYATLSRYVMELNPDPSLNPLLAELESGEENSKTAMYKCKCRA